MKTEKFKPKKRPGKKNTKNYHPAIARIDQVSNVLKEIVQWQYPADSVLSHWFRSNPKAGARDRSEITRAVFNVLRHLRRYRQYAQSGQGPNTRRLAILGLASYWEADKLSAGLDNYEQAWLKHLENISLSSLPLEIRYSVPDWLLENLSEIENIESLLDSLNKPAPLDLRVNILKSDRNKVLDFLEQNTDLKDKFAATPYSPWGIRINTNPAINGWDIFKSGAIEIQDEGSQLLGLLLAPKRGELVIDFCAGAGGKTLLLGAMMRSTGRLYAFDVSAARLARAKQRIARSGLSNVTTVTINDNDNRVKRLRGKADRVLVDAPCSGLGTLRRNPDLKWRQQPNSIKDLCVSQSRILDQAASCLKSGGRLVYATCSVLPQENEQQIKDFLSRNQDFKLLNASEILASRDVAIDFKDDYLRLRPDLHNTDGFFAAVMQKN